MKDKINIAHTQKNSFTLHWKRVSNRTIAPSVRSRNSVGCFVVVFFKPEVIIDHAMT